MSKRRTVLIVKTGFSEFLDNGISTTVSLGDVLICTALLHLYKKEHVTWLASWQSQELLEENPHIHDLLIFGTEAFAKLSQSSYDIIINLEKDIGICTFLNQIQADKRYGFYFCDRTHEIQTHNQATRYLLAGQENHHDIHKSALEILYETVDARWDGQGLILGRAIRGVEKYDIGFNHAVGSKWPTKAWPMSHWQELEELLKEKLTLSWQQGHEHLITYIEWINSCRMIVTSDSLGQAIGQALGKKVVTLYGPTNFHRMQGVPNVQVVPSKLPCPYMPCFLRACKHDKFCMDAIEPQVIARLCQEQLALIS